MNFLANNFVLVAVHIHRNLKRVTQVKRQMILKEVWRSILGCSPQLCIHIYAVCCHIFSYFSAARRKNKQE